MDKNHLNHSSETKDHKKAAMNSHTRQRQRVQARRQQELYKKNISNKTESSSSVHEEPVQAEIKHSDTGSQSKRHSAKVFGLKKRGAEKPKSPKSQVHQEVSKKTKKKTRTIFGLTFTGNLKADWAAFTPKERRKFVLISVLAFIIAFMLIFCIFELATTPKLEVEKLSGTQSAKIMDKNGEYYQSLETEEYREIVSLDQIPQHVQNAFVDIEDQRFYSHKGVDFKGLVRAALGVFSSASLNGPGGSTITQQLIKTTHLSSEKTLGRKFHEIVLAIELESVWSKNQILEAYLNRINFAQTWGIQAAAKTYFNVDVSQLTLAQASVLAAMPKSPHYFEPLCWDEEGNLVRLEDGRCKYNENNRERALLVLDKMQELGHASAEDVEAAKAQINDNQIGLTYNPQRTIYSSFTDALYNTVLQDLQDELKLTEEEAVLFLQNESPVIYSTIDQEVQSAMEEAAADDSLYPGQSYSAALASEALSADRGEEIDFIPQVAMTVIDNDTGGVVGMVGGRGEKTNLSLNRATQRFQPGSSTKPLTTYGPGLDTKAITLGTVFADVPISYGSWRPTNSGGGYSGGNMTVRDGFRQSLNTMAVQACVQTGFETCAAYGEKVGLYIDRENDADINGAALALGGYSHGQSTLAMASAYSSFPNKGVHKSYKFYTKITDKDGKVLIEKKTEETKVYSEETAYLITDVLQQAIKGGTTTIYCDQPIAGKTGTTDEQRHAWICGYTPYYSMAVWYGYDENYVETSQGDFELNIGIFGGSKPGPASMFETVMNAINNGKEAASFPEKPSSIVSATIDTQSGLLASSLSSSAGHIVTELFIEGSVPSKTDDSHYSVKICRESGQLATQYCTDTEDQVFFSATNHFPTGISGTPIANEAPGDTCNLHTSAPVTPTPSKTDPSATPSTPTQQ